MSGLDITSSQACVIFISMTMGPQTARSPKPAHIIGGGWDNSGCASLDFKGKRRAKHCLSAAVCLCPCGHVLRAQAQVDGLHRHR